MTSVDTSQYPHISRVPHDDRGVTTVFTRGEYLAGRVRSDADNLVRMSALEEFLLAGTFAAKV